MEEKGLSPLQLAEELSVQRSSISHILNGRNKPSLDFLKKLISVYPDVDLHHLISGESQPAQADLFSEAQSTPSVVSITESISGDTNVNNSNSEVGTDVNRAEETQRVVANTPVTTDRDRIVTSVSSRESKPHRKEPEVDTPLETNAARKLLKVVLLYSDGSFEEYSS